MKTRTKRVLRTDSSNRQSSSFLYIGMTTSLNWFIQFLLTTLPSLRKFRWQTLWKLHKQTYCIRQKQILFINTEKDLSKKSFINSLTTWSTILVCIEGNFLKMNSLRIQKREFLGKPPKMGVNRNTIGFFWPKNLFK